MAGTDQEILFLIAKYLEGTPLVETSSTLIEELSSHSLLGTATDWQGETSVVTYPAYSSRFPNVNNEHLLQLLQSHHQSNNNETQDKKTNTLVSTSYSSLLGPIGHDGFNKKQCLQLIKKFRQSIIALTTKRAQLSLIQKEFKATKLMEASLMLAQTNTISQEMSPEILPNTGNMSVEEGMSYSEMPAESADRRKLNEMTRKIKDSQAQV